MVGLVSNAQTCVGPYQVFESFKTKGNTLTAGTMAYEAWTFGGSATTNTSTPGNARSGNSYGIVGYTASPNQYIQTPKIIENPSSFLCYIRGGNTVNTTYKIEWSSDITFATGVSTTGALTTGGTTTYNPIFINSSNNSGSNGQGFGAATNIYIRVTVTAGAAIFIDDMSWISSDATKIKQ